MSNFYLTLIFIIIVAATSLVFYRGRPSYFAKFAVCALCVAAVTAVSLSFESYKGWPSQEHIIKGRLKAVDIVHPGVNTNGHIYVWVYGESAGESKGWVSTFLYQYPDYAPRNFVLPYTKQSAKKFSAAKKALDNGDIVEIDGQNGAGVAGGDGSVGDASNKGKAALSAEDTASGGKGDTDTGDDYSLKITPAESVLRKE